MKKKELIIKSKQNPKLSCHVTFISTGLKLELYIHEKWWIFGWDNRVSLEYIDIEFINEKNFINPHAIRYQHGGTLEIWTEGTFKLEERVEDMFAKYNAAEERQRQLEESLNNIYENIHTRKI